MSNALTKTTGNAVAVPANLARYGELANRVAPKSVYGVFLKFAKGDYFAGQNNDEIPIGARFCAIMGRMSEGYIKWVDKRPAETKMVEYSTNDPSPVRADLGDHDKSQWPLENGQRKDPWQQTFYVPLVSEAGDVYTMTLSSSGAISAVGLLSRAYFQGATENPGKLPVIELGVDSYPHKKFGRIKFPVFTIVGWVNAAKYEAALESAAAKKEAEEDENYNHGGPESENPGAGFDDEIPF